VWPWNRAILDHVTPRQSPHGDPLLVSFASPLFPPVSCTLVATKSMLSSSIIPSDRPAHRPNRSTYRHVQTAAPYGSRHPQLLADQASSAITSRVLTDSRTLPRFLLPLPFLIRTHMYLQYNGARTSLSIRSTDDTEDAVQY
jgi:hypothetical protein